MKGGGVFVSYRIVYLYLPSRYLASVLSLRAREVFKLKCLNLFGLVCAAPKFLNMYAPEVPALLFGLNWCGFGLVWLS